MGWISLFEIAPKGREVFNGIEEWGVISGGTTTANLPPEHIIEDFKKILTNYL